MPKITQSDLNVALTVKPAIPCHKTSRFSGRSPSSALSTVASYPTGFVQAIIIWSIWQVVKGIHSALKPEPNIRCTPNNRHSVWWLVLSVSTARVLLGDPNCIHVLLLQLPCHAGHQNNMRQASYLRREGRRASLQREEKVMT